MIMFTEGENNRGENPETGNEDKIPIDDEDKGELALAMAIFKKVKKI